MIAFDDKSEARPRFFTPAGEIIGWRDQNVIRVTGVPYASATRFQPPVDIPPFKEPFVANKWSPACPQTPESSLQKMLGDPPLAHLGVEEQCQHLSITIPSNISPTDRLPVMVWIHGGSYATGAGDATIFDPGLLVEEQRVIVVNVTYRLGLLGFLGGYANRSANLGLLDMIAALRWIKQNIAGFGGDADNITLFGQSSGGDAIANLMIATGAQELFHRVVIQSAPLGISRGRQQMTAAMMAKAADIPVQASLEEVLANHDVVAAEARAYGLKAGMPFGLQYGYVPLPEEGSLENAWLRCAPHYDVLIGFAEQETLFFLPFKKSLQRIARLPLIGAPLIHLLVRITTGKVYSRPAIDFAKRHAKGGGKSWLYTITWKQGMGPIHTMDLPLLFGDKHTWQHAKLVEGIAWDVLHEQGKQVRALWAQFARLGQLEREGQAGNEVLQYKAYHGT